MQYESEGIIRRQVVKLITALFIHNTLKYVNNQKLDTKMFCLVSFYIIVIIR